MADKFGTSKGRFHASIKRIISGFFLLTLMQESIRWPSTQAKVTETSQRFGEKSQVQNVIRTIDGCHIQINAPMQKPQVYYNRKQFN